MLGVRLGYSQEALVEGETGLSVHSVPLSQTTSVGLHEGE